MLSMQLRLSHIKGHNFLNIRFSTLQPVHIRICQGKMIHKSLILITLIISLSNCKADPLAKTVINEMLKVIIDHTEWDNWEAWYTIMQGVRMSKQKNKPFIISNNFLFPFVSFSLKTWFMIPIGVLMAA